MEKSNNKKITNIQARELRARRKINPERWTVAQLAIDYKISQTAVRNIINFKTYIAQEEPFVITLARKTLLNELAQATKVNEYRRLTKRLIAMDVTGL